MGTWDDDPKPTNTGIASVSQYVSAFAAYIDLFHKMSDSVFLLDTEVFSILDSNESSRQLLGAQGGQLLGCILHDWLHPLDRAPFLALLQRAKDSNVPQSGSFSCVGSGGRDFVLETMACTLKLSNGMDVIQVIARDITTQIELERNAQEYLAQLESANTQLRRMSVTDELTGLANFRHFQQQLAARHAEAARQKREYAIVFCDLDHFKAYNDRNGHLAGDELLKQFSKLIQSLCRSSDLAARYGGEEFVMLCTGSDAQAVAGLAERLRATTAATAFSHGQHQPLGKVTVSIGVASYPLSGATPAEVLDCADQLAYSSKEAGRDRVSISTGKAPAKKAA